MHADPMETSLNTETKTVELEIVEGRKQEISGRDANALWAAGFVLLAIVFMIAATTSRFIRKKRYLSQDFEWFKRSHPDNVVTEEWVDGKTGAKRTKVKTICPTCGCEYTRTERMMKGWYIRKHVCQLCAKTLYYSKE